MSSKTEMKTKVPVTAPQAKSSSHDTRKADKPSGPKSNNNKVNEVCRFFLKNECSRGSNCSFLHTKPTGSSSNKYSPSKKQTPSGHLSRSMLKKTQVCRKFVKGTCQRSENCYYYHPSVEEMRGYQEEREAWFALCPDILSDFCSNPQCSYFHITKQNEDMYRYGGEISPELVDQAMHVSLAKDLTLIGTMPYCKEYIRGMCNHQNCHLRHLNEKEYKDEVFYALLEEFQQKYGPPESQPFPPPVATYNEHQDDYHNSMHPSSHMMSGYPDDPMGVNDNPGMMAPYPDDMMAADMDNHNFMRPHPDHEPERERERKRMRYQYDDPSYPIDDMRYDNSADYEWERSQYSMDKESRMDHIISKQKDKIDMEIRREFEAKTRDMRERMNRLEEENSKLREDAIEIQVSHRVEMKTLTATNTTLVEDRRKAQEAVLHLQQENDELRRAMDSKVKVASSELKKRLDVAEMEADKARESFTKLNSMLRESESKRSKLIAEIGSLRSKSQDRQGRVASGKDLQLLDTNSGYNSRDGYARDTDLQGYNKQGDHPFNKGGHSMQGQWSGHMEPNRSNEGLLRNPQHSRTMEIPSITEVIKRNYDNVERKNSRSQYNNSTRYREEWN
ncbi:hypothetical protein Pmani_001756 [Petrolisthes manimaculis]|uniref:C3H1-type domain-containing protein n=1 Tax=Petrolisthes manimaculis TaxID=1843537 RepID=A0AAE1UP51_9EUCA|nr:hypothetical protein Pmani_001756 [Petrolisthes manimaculis]